MFKIYLSSTYEDLKDYRRVVFDALRKAGHKVIAMEDYVAADQRPVDQCLNDVEHADIYIGLFAFRYGYVPPPHHQNPGGLSITELEYRRAESLRKPRLTFVVDDATAWPRVFDDAYGAADKGDRIRSLRQHLLTEKLASSFSAPHELSTLVLAAVAKYGETQSAHPSPTGTAVDTSVAVTWNIEEKGSPYPGLMHFTRKYAPVFFGRDVEVREILDRMRGPGGRFIIVSGESGVGKSSIVDAGILPKLEDGGLPGSLRCECVRMVPSQKKDSWSSLLDALGSMATRAGLRPDTIIEELNRKPETLSSHIKRILKDGSEGQALVLFLDQMEELFTSQDMAKSGQFLSALYRAAQKETVWVLATIRSDQLHHCHRHPAMLKVLGGAGHYPVGPVELFMLTEMILKPAHCAGLRITDRLARRIIEDAGTQEGNLPLLGFVLEKLFENRTDHELSEDLYQGLGGVAGAIGVHVKTVEEKIEQTAASKAGRLFPDIFQTLARVQKEEGVPTRNRPLLADFTGPHRTVVDLLITERLLRTEGEGEEATVSLSHERLFDAWPALKDYVDTHKKALVDRTLLEGRARKWAEMGKPWFAGLASGREYRDYCRVGVSPTLDMHIYLAASRMAHRVMIGAVSIVLLLLIGTNWLWQKGYSLHQGGLKAYSLVRSIHVPPKMVRVQGGKFTQGDSHNSGDPDERPPQKVTVHSFALGMFEVTFEEYDRFAIATGRALPGDRDWGRGSQPVINVSWDDAKEYSRWLSQQEGKHFRLPTESEWEYAARSKGKDQIWAGTSEEKELAEYAIYYMNSGNRTAPISEARKPNGLDLKLYDMSGNVSEWVEDCWHDNYVGAPPDGSAWLESDGGYCSMHVTRGGSWNVGPHELRLVYRNRILTDSQYSNIGFRLAQDIDE